jgi:valyl-tRNA synthetase
VWSESQVTRERVLKHLHRYRFDMAVDCVYGFIKTKCCDWFIESIKASEQSGRKKTLHHDLVVLLCVLTDTLKILHPITPAVTTFLLNKNSYLMWVFNTGNERVKPRQIRSTIDALSGNIIKSSQKLVQYIKKIQRLTQVQKMVVVFMKKPLGIRYVVDSLKRVEWFYGINEEDAKKFSKGSLEFSSSTLKCLIAFKSLSSSVQKQELSTITRKLMNMTFISCTSLLDLMNLTKDFHILKASCSY